MGSIRFRKVLIIIMFSVILSGCSSKEDAQNKQELNQNNDRNEFVEQEQNPKNDQTGAVDKEKGSSKETNMQNESNDDPNTIRWALPTMSLEGYNGEIERRINEKLRKDGYDFRLEFVYIDYLNYNNLVKDCDADIVWTGMRRGEDIKSLSPAYTAIKENKYLCMDSLLKDSRLYDLYPEMLWDSVRINESIYCIPNTVLPDCGLALAFRKDKYGEEEINSFDNTLEGLLKLLGDDGILGFSVSMGDYLDMYGISNTLDYMYFEDGQIKNLMENDLNIQWIRALNKLAQNRRLVKEGSVSVIENNEEPDWSIAMFYTGDAINLDDEKFWKIYYKGDYGDNFKASIAIRADSAKTENAFKLLELLLTNSAYGNLALYGSDVKEENGFAINPQNGAKWYIFPLKMYLGINDGVLRGEVDYYSFGTPEERADYYEKYIRKGNTSWMEYPEFTGELYYLIEKHEKLITNTNNFEEELVECIQDVKAAFDLLK